MDNELLRVKMELKKKRRKEKEVKIKNNKFSKVLSKILITIVLTLITLISLKSNTKFKTFFYKNVYDTNFSFATVNKWYKDLFGSPIPFSDVIEKETTTPVFNESLEYSEKSKYKDGVKLTVTKNYLTPVLESGMVVFIGEKEGYGNTVIVQQVDGIDVWYSNLKTVSVKLYDYIEKGSLLGEVNDSTLYIIYKKEGKVLNYEEYL